MVEVDIMNKSDVALAAVGLSRLAYDEPHNLLLISFTRTPTDDELRVFHDYITAWNRRARACTERKTG
jgi:hypothetical protein